MIKRERTERVVVNICMFFVVWAVVSMGVSQLFPKTPPVKEVTQYLVLIVDKKIETTMMPVGDIFVSSKSYLFAIYLHDEISWIETGYEFYDSLIIGQQIIIEERDGYNHLFKVIPK